MSTTPANPDECTLSKVEVPDIGDFDDVPVIEILVSVGDTVAAEDPLVTLESDKATMDVPAPFAGVVREISVAIGDRVSQGSVLMSLEGAGDGDSDAAHPSAEPAEQAAAADRTAQPTTAPSEMLEAPQAPEPRPRGPRRARDARRAQHARRGRAPRPQATAGGRSMPARRPAGWPASSASTCTP